MIIGHHQLVALHFIRYIQTHIHNHILYSTWPSNDTKREKKPAHAMNCMLHMWVNEMQQSIYPSIHLFCHTYNTHTHKHIYSRMRCPMETLKLRAERQEIEFRFVMFNWSLLSSCALIYLWHFLFHWFNSLKFL